MLMKPCSRASGWRRCPIDGFPKDYDDMGLNCGGFQTQWQTNGGKCGICGDPWDGSRRYERPGGDMVQNLIVATNYQEGQVIEVEVKVTASHKGWHEFRICDTRHANGIEATQECLDTGLLADHTGKIRFRQGASAGTNVYHLALPQGLTCDLCVLQWKWHCGNNVPVTGPQEEFYSCADVSIQDGPKPPTTPATQPPRPSTQPTPGTVRHPYTAFPPTYRPPSTPYPPNTKTPTSYAPWNDPSLPFDLR